MTQAHTSFGPYKLLVYVPYRVHTKYIKEKSYYQHKVIYGQYSQAKVVI